MALPNNPKIPSRHLSREDAIESWILREKGHLKNRIAAHLDVNIARLYDVWHEKQHVGSKQEAIARLSTTDPILAERLAAREIEKDPPANDNAQMDLFANDNENDDDGDQGQGRP